jgi:putative DNA primase/helicase
MSNLEQFRDAMRSVGLEPPEVIEMDGKLRRFASNGKYGDDAGWYVLHGDGIAAGAFGDWRSGVSETWRANVGRTLTPTEEAAHRAKVETMRREREAEETRRKAEAATKATTIWHEAQAVPDDHPYLKRKGIKAHGVRLYNDALCNTDARWRRASFPAIHRAGW